ncbi:short-chain dehydrogenase [Vibrio cidicii]|uniref:SDR family NAD(P)-dependent oxidoreductase n=1 Tax=Vibrio cidicii TaxID=1763883 RepID=UPI0018C2F94C|nr:SDR family oxidoreductase [Vibrio cidicii]MBG0758855.1 short-chain dehydrogenase [Vibrio cidicii]
MKQKTYLVTGGSAGIGLATTKALLAQGDRVIITGRNKEKLASVAQSLSGDLHWLVADSGKLSDLQALGSMLQQENWHLDGVVLNAGVYQPNVVGESTEEAFDYTFDINVKGTFFTIQSLLPVLKKGSSLVVISSLVVEKAFANSSFYMASKSALEGLIAGLSLDLADSNIRINSIQPGVTATEIQGKSGMDEAQINELHQWMSSTPLGRILVPEDIVPSICFLLGDGSVGMRHAKLLIDAGMNL